jgi:hypothetical protein
MKNKKSMLTDDKARIGYQDGTKVKNKDLEVMLVDLEFTASQITELMDMAEDEREKIIKDKEEDNKKEAFENEKAAARFAVDAGVKINEEDLGNDEPRDPKYGGGMLSDDTSRMAYEEGEEVKTHMMPDGTEMAGATHGEYEEEMTMPAEEMAMPAEEMDMVPDKQMEQDHLDFIINESLDAEEETYLMEMLQADDRLSMIFDKVMDTASEFSGDGPVEGLGTGESDSIPARLSDGEFVMTAQATDEIGSDNLQNMMDGAEESSDYREQVAMGGEMQDKSQVDQFGKSIDKDLAEEEIRRSMLSVNPRLQ